MHELYCLGHLAEFAAAYHSLTGSDDLIEVVRRMVELVRKVVLPKGGYPGHQELELGLVRLYEITRDDIFLDTAGFFIRERGKHDENDQTYYDREAFARGADPYNFLGSENKSSFRHPRDYAYMQAHIPLVTQKSIEGHCVRAMYYLIGAQHYSLMAPDTKDIQGAVQHLFNNTVNQKMYITGGIGSVARSEGFGPDYFLPDLQAGGCCYSETCASFGLIILCEKLLRENLHRVYGDVMERALLNCVLGAVSMQGGSFYYENPLATVAGAPWNRSKWFEVSCCPPNVAKLLGLLPSLPFSTRESTSTIAIHLFLGSNFTTKLNGKDVSLKMETNVPWEGSVKITVDTQTKIELAIRIPSWAADDYKSSEKGEVKDGYLYIPIGPSSSSTVIDLYLPTAPKFVYAHPKTRKNEVAITRGPLVYCAESPDNEFDLENTFVHAKDIKEVRKIDIAGVKDVPILEVRAKVKTAPARNEPLYNARGTNLDPEEKPVILLPFFLRMHRGGSGAMRVWLSELPSID